MRQPVPVHCCCRRSFSVGPYCCCHASVRRSSEVAAATTPVGQLVGRPVEMRSGLVVIFLLDFRFLADLASAAVQEASDFVELPEQQLRCYLWSWLTQVVMECAALSRSPERQTTKIQRKLLILGYRHNFNYFYQCTLLHISRLNSKIHPTDRNPLCLCCQNTDTRLGQ